jgi:hypothetical protein
VEVIVAAARTRPERLGRPAHAAAVRLPLHASLLLTVISNPLWIALTAPGRRVNDRFSRHPHQPPDR